VCYKNYKPLNKIGNQVFMSYVKNGVIEKIEVKY
jgi:hypothetical protein